MSSSLFFFYLSSLLCIRFSPSCHAVLSINQSPMRSSTTSWDGRYQTMVICFPFRVLIFCCCVLSPASWRLSTWMELNSWMESLNGFWVNEMWSIRFSCLPRILSGGFHRTLVSTIDERWSMQTSMIIFLLDVVIIERAYLLCLFHYALWSVARTHKNIRLVNKKINIKISAFIYWNNDDSGWTRYRSECEGNPRIWVIF